MNDQKALIEKIIYRLINYDNVIIKLDKSSWKDDADKEGEEDSTTTTAMDESDPILVVHPNYVQTDWEIFFFYTWISFKIKNNL